MKLKNILLTVMTIILVSNQNVVSAAENIGVSTEPPQIELTPDEGISVFGVDIPGKSSLYNTNQYEIIQGSSNTTMLYTNKCYKNIYKITCTISNDSNKDLKVQLCYHSYLSDVGYGIAKTETIPANSQKTIYFNDLKESKYYFLSFSAPSDFEGKMVGFEMGE